MGYKDCGERFGKPKVRQLLLHIHAGKGIQCPEWFIHQQHLGRHGQHARYADTLFHSARQLVWIGIFKSLQPDQ